MKIRRFVKKILKEEWIHFIGTDAHSMGNRKPEMTDCAKYLIRKCGEEYASDILYANAVHVIKNEPLY